MPIYYPDILQQTTPSRRFSYAEKDVMLYALGVGLGRDPLDARQLAFVYEHDLRVLPTAATVLDGADPGALPLAVPAGARLSSLNYAMLLHGEQKVELHRPLPPAGDFAAHDRVRGVWDKGEGRGAVICKETVWTDASGERIATLTTTLFARGDGGFGGPAEGAPSPHAIPGRTPDLTVEVETRPDQALLYRLNGDRNPLHADPQAARAAGFERPILHGLCTYGLTCRAVVEHCADFDPARVASHEARFSAPVFPGETLAVDLWRDGAVVSFQARAPGRGVTVIRNGRTVLR